MRIFVIADSCRRRKRPCGVLSFDEGSGEFHIRISLRADALSTPLSLGMYLRSGRHELTAEESLGWVRSRLVPPDRQNIQQVLQANGLREYSEIDLLERSRGYSCNDDLEVYEVDAALCQGLDCDEIIDHCQRVSSGGEVRYMVMQTERERTEQRKMVRGKSTGKASGKTPEHGEIRYAVVSLPLEGAALSIGQQIRQARKHAGLTQQELAANAGIRQSVLSGLENGTGNPTLGLLEDVAAGLGKVLKVALEDPDGPEGDPAVSG